ncbi:hypothetical protein OESDEN_08964 [Oesophagostomum dentatum]|uniref:acid phosphatase n=1 Tax=Oesophagostomum dentatum TaxID=61180 RepID=A0A0B1T0Y3_OESDE|nr:hypothetical protein OESDEN_08964 [Oesophagostomum dentatum]
MTWNVHTIEFMAGVGAYHNRIWIQTRSGKLLLTILKNLREAMEKTSSRKFIAFSTHDVTIAALLDSMGLLKAALTPQGRPSFVSTIAFELWQNDDKQYYIKVLYRRGPGSDEFRDLGNEVEGCKKEKLCTVENFSAAIENYTSDDPAALCLDHGTTSSSRNELELIVILMVATTFFAVLFLAVLIFLIPCRGPSSSKIDATNAEHSYAGRTQANR